MNKIKGQAATKRDSRAKISAEKIRNEAQSNNITPAMIEAGFMVLEQSGYLEEADSGARLLPAQVLQAMLDAAHRGGVSPFW